MKLSEETKDMFKFVWSFWKAIFILLPLMLLPFVLIAIGLHYAGY